MAIKNLPLILGLLISCLSAGAQPALKWAAPIGTADSIKPTAIAISSKGEVVTAGSFYESNDFNPGPAVTMLNPMGASAFITKLDSNRNLLWARQMGGSANDTVHITDIDIDTAGCIYITGYYTGTVNLSTGGMPAWFGSQSPNSREAFICKLKPNGNFLWAQNFSGGNGSVATSIETNKQGNMYVSGYFSGTVYSTWGGMNITSSGQDMFLVRADTGGAIHWIKTSAGNARAYAVTMDHMMNAYVSGTFSGTTNFSPGGSGVNLTGNGDDAFVAKYDAAGSLMWAHKLSGAGNEEARSLVADKAGNVIVGGSYTTSIDCDPGTGTFTLGGSTPPQGCYGYFLTKLTAAGNFAWAVSPAASGTCNPKLPMAIDTFDNIYVTGDFGDTLDFDPGSGTYNLAPNGPVMVGSQPVLNPDIFISRFDENGNLVWARSLGSVYENERGETIAVDAAGQVYTAGTFSDTVDFHPGVAVSNVIAPRAAGIAQKGMYIQKIWQCPGLKDSVNIDACRSHVFNNSVYTSSGIYTTVIPSVSGCDSTIKLNLTVHNIDTTVTQNGLTLTANETGATYQWINCYNRLNPAIPGATNASFTTSITGVYAVVVTKNGCSDTSSCNFLIGTGVTERDFSANIALYPNPTNEKVTVNFGSLQQKVDLVISNIASQIVQRKTVTSAAGTELKIEGAKGIYIIKLTGDNGQTAYVKLVKE